MTKTDVQDERKPLMRREPLPADPPSGPGSSSDDGANSSLPITNYLSLEKHGEFQAPPDPSLEPSPSVQSSAGQEEQALLEQAQDPDRKVAVQMAVRETVVIARLSFPCISSSVLIMVNRMVMTIMVGHIGAKELGSTTLALMFGNVLGFSLCYGMATALDTLASQAVTGAADKRAAGIFLQRAILINLVMAVPIFAVWTQAEPLLLLAGQEPELAKMAADCIKIMSGGLIPNIITNCVAKFLQAQGLMDAQFYVCLIVFPINIATQYLLVFSDTPFHMGFFGAPLGNVLADTWSCLGLIIYATCINGYQCWHPWTRAALRDWRQFLNLGLPGLLQVSLEWWLFELIALIAGLFGATTLAAQSVVVDTTALMYMIFLGVSIAASNRVGNLLGAGQARSARLAAFASVIVTWVMAIVTCLILVLGRRLWAHVFTSDEAVIELVTQVLPVCAIFQFADGGAAVLGGILRGCGKQKIGAIVNFVSYYVFGLPLGLFFTFTLKMELRGIWTGLAIALWLTLIMQMAYIAIATDWDYEVVRALRRVNQESVATDQYHHAIVDAESGPIQNAEIGRESSTM